MRSWPRIDVIIVPSFGDSHDRPAVHSAHRPDPAGRGAGRAHRRCCTPGAAASRRVRVPAPRSGRAPGPRAHRAGRVAPAVCRSPLCAAAQPLRRVCRRAAPRCPASGRGGGLSSLCRAPLRPGCDLRGPRSAGDHRRAAELDRVRRPDGWGLRRGHRGASSATYDAYGNPHYSAGSGVAVGIGVLLIFAGFAAIIGVWVWNRVVRQGRTGQSVGKKMFGLKLIDSTSGQPIGAGNALLRDIVHGVVNQVVYLSYLWMLWDPNRLTLGDMVVKSTVIKVPKV
ncbi:MAG TPA: RDD family protein [Phycicoccus sp.]|nr:RDD family protein [Phycicoccus sp.]